MENKKEFYRELSILLNKHKVAVCCKAEEVLFQFYSDEKVEMAKAGRNHLTATNIQQL